MFSIDQLVSFLCNLKFVNPNFKKKEYRHPSICHFSEIPIYTFNSSTKHNLEYEIFPIPIPNILQHLKKKYEKKYGITFNSITIEKHECQYNELWTENHPYFSFHIVICENKNEEILLRLKKGKQLYCQNIQHKDSIFKTKMDNITWKQNIICNKENHKPFYVINFHNNTLFKINKYNKYIYSNPISLSHRLLYNNQIKEYMKILYFLNQKHKEPYHQTMDELKIYDIHKEKNLGNGTWGEVYKYSVFHKKYNFALKISRLDKEHTTSVKKNKTLKNDIKWHEQFIYKNIIGQHPHPNLPIYINSFICPEYSFSMLRKQQQQIFPATVTCFEMAHGDLRYFLSRKTKLNNNMFLSIFFQIASAIHSMQILCQNVNRDIKPSNILFFGVKSSGFWKYIINNKTYYVPNKGIVCLLTDFGVSKTYDPRLILSNDKKILKLGTRVGIHDEKKNQLIPIKGIKTNKMFNWKFNVQSPLIQPSINVNTHYISNFDILQFKLTPRQKMILKNSNIKSNDSLEWLSNPWIIPPIEFYTDIQDLCKMFCNFKLDQCKQQKQNRCCHNLCKDCKDFPQHIHTCSTCNQLCKKCALSKRHCQTSFHIPYSCIDHDFVRQFLNKVIIKEVNVTNFPKNSYYYLMGKTIEHLFSDYYTSPKKNIIDIYHL